MILQCAHLCVQRHRWQFWISLEIFVPTIGQRRVHRVTKIMKYSYQELHNDRVNNSRNYALTHWHVGPMVAGPTCQWGGVSWLLFPYTGLGGSDDIRRSTRSLEGKAWCYDPRGANTAVSPWLPCTILLVSTLADVPGTSQSHACSPLMHLSHHFQAETLDRQTDTDPTLLL